MQATRLANRARQAKVKRRLPYNRKGGFQNYTRFLAHSVVMNLVTMTNFEKFVTNHNADRVHHFEHHVSNW